MYSFHFSLKQRHAAATFLFCLWCIILQAQATGCACSAGKPNLEQQAKHECTCHKTHQTRLQKVLAYFKGTYLRGGLEMRRYTQVARSKADVGFIWGLGYEFHSEPMRIELIMQYNKMTFRANTTALKAKARTFFINGYYDFVYEPLQAKHLTPYMTAGAGQTKYYDGSILLFSKDSQGNTSSQASPANLSKTKVAWNAGLGLKFDFNDHIAVDAGYRYLVLGKFVQTNHIKGHQGLVSAIFKM